MSDANPLQGYIDTWWTVVGENADFLRTLEPADWEKPTDLPGWNVRHVASHMAHLESALAGNPQPEVDVPDLPHLKGPMNVFTESGPLARADWTTDQIIDEMENSAAKRRDSLAAMMPLDPKAPGDSFAAIAGWDWSKLLSNRGIDQWMHQQDIRRAVDRPGGLDGVGAAHALRVFGGGLGFVVGKRSDAPAGATVVLEITGAQPTTLAVRMGDDGRAARLDIAPHEPTVKITMDFETFIILSGGRRSPQDVNAIITGDTDLGETILANLAVTP